jgi:hypothetical protein
MLRAAPNDRRNEGEMDLAADSTWIAILEDEEHVVLGLMRHQLLEIRLELRDIVGQERPRLRQ